MLISNVVVLVIMSASLISLLCTLRKLDFVEFTQERNRLVLIYLAFICGEIFQIFSSAMSFAHEGSVDNSAYEKHFYKSEQVLTLLGRLYPLLSFFFPVICLLHIHGKCFTVQKGTKRPRTVSRTTRLIREDGLNSTIVTRDTTRDALLFDNENNNASPLDDQDEDSFDRTLSPTSSQCTLNSVSQDPRNESA